MTLTTARLTLDEWRISDWADFRPIAQDPRVMRYISGGAPWSDGRIREFVERQVQLYAQRGFCRWRVRHAGSGELIGFCGAGMWRGRPDPEIGWWLAAPWWGRGLATEAARCALADVFERVELESVISVAMPENRASLRVMEKLGLRFQRQFENEGVPLVQYGITREDFRARPAAL